MAATVKERSVYRGASSGGCGRQTVMMQTVLNVSSYPKLEEPSNSSRNNFGKITRKELVVTCGNRKGSVTDT